jgi:hypothetical protein
MTVDNSTDLLTYSRCRKAASTIFTIEVDACRAKAEQLQTKCCLSSPIRRLVIA